MNKVPERWLECPRKGECIHDKFIPIKTPLSNEYNIDVAQRWTPLMAIRSIRSLNYNIGLWVDLTYSKRFYNGDSVTNEDIKYLKIPCRGHNIYPNEIQKKTFIEACIEVNPNKIIVVHCTHGFNRSGFLICSFLTEVLKINILSAISLFAEKRQPGIYKQSYLNGLCRKYNARNFVRAPPLPYWDSSESRNDSNEDDDEIDSGLRKKIKLKKLKLHGKFMVKIDGVEVVSNYQKALAIINKVHQLCDWRARSFPGCQPVSIDIYNISLLNETYNVSWKADGVRYMMLIDENEVFLIDRNNAVFSVHNLRFPQRKAPREEIQNTLVDGEMIVDKENGTSRLRYLIYDIVSFSDTEVSKCDFKTRMMCIERELILPREDAKRDGLINRNEEPFSIRKKEFWPLTQVRQLLDKKFANQLSHDLDGLIFQPCLLPYTPGACDKVLKWKPPHLNSIDFKLKKVIIKQDGMLNRVVGSLYCKNSSEVYGYLYKAPNIENLDNKIVECSYDIRNNEWLFIRVRTDKSFPNTLETADAVYVSIFSMITKKSLLEFIESIFNNSRKKTRKH